jgi:hypothetical protein
VCGNVKIKFKLSTEILDSFCIGKTEKISFRFKAKFNPVCLFLMKFFFSKMPEIHEISLLKKKLLEQA